MSVLSRVFTFSVAPLLVAGLLVSCTTNGLQQDVANAADAQASAQNWRKQLNLEVLPLESGWWAFIGKSALTVTTPDGDQVPAYNAIYYLLDEERPINYWHWLASDDTHVLVDGGPVEYIIVSPEGAVSRHVLGKDIAAGQQLTVTSPANGYKAVRLIDPKGFALMASLVTPAWAPHRVRVAPPVLTPAERPAWLTDTLMHSLTSPEVPRHPQK